MIYFIILMSFAFSNPKLESIKSEINILKNAIVNDDFEEISKFFEFPITHKESVENFFYGDKLDSINKEYFKNNYKRIFDSNFIDLFKTVNIDSIQDGNSIFEFLTDDPLCNRNTISFNINKYTIIITCYFESSEYSSISELNLEDAFESDFFCSESSYIFVFSFAENNLMFNEFEIILSGYLD